MFHRDALDDLQEWSERETDRKPMLMRGARQVGKTTLVRMLAERTGLQLVEINMEKPWRFTPTLAELDVKKTLEAMEFELGTDIDPKRSLLFFDEVQACPELLPLLRYFYEEAPEYRVIATGSLVDFVLSEPAFSIPTGRIDLYHLGPLTLREFLSALKEEKAKAFLDQYRMGETVSGPIHAKLNHLVRLFAIVGGMPEAVRQYAKDRRFKEVERIKSGIVETFRLDFNKYRHKADPELLTLIFDALPNMLGKKVIYSNISPVHRSRELSFALNQLCRARIAAKVFLSRANGIPLAAERNDRFFKMLFLDCGLLLTRLGLSPTETERVTELNLVNEGILAEQFIGQHLLQMPPAHRSPELYYWAREKRSASAEVDFVIADGSGRVVPVEVKAGSTGRLRSLHIMVFEKNLPLAVRFCSSPPSLLQESRGTPKGTVKFQLISLPHYLVQQLPRILADLDQKAET